MRKRKLRDRLDQRRTWAIYGVLAGALLFSLIFLGSPEPQTQYLMNSNTTIETVSDNKIGDLLVRSRGIMPVLYTEPDLKVCVYTEAGQAPFITRAETESIDLLGPGGFEKRDILLSIPTEELSRSFEGSFKTYRADKCPIRTGNKTIVVVEK